MVLVIPECFLVALRASSGGQPVVNVIGVHGPNDTAISVATAVDTAWAVANGPLTRLPTPYLLSEIRVMDLSSTSGQVYSMSVNRPGILSSALATNASCALVTYGSGTRAKSEKGRMYFGPLREADINSDGRTLATPATYTTAFENFRNSLNNFGRTWSVLSRKNSTHNPIASINTQPVIATQRRRIR